jgi:hypothetical protein
MNRINQSAAIHRGRRTGRRHAISFLARNFGTTILKSIDFFFQPILKINQHHLYQYTCLTPKSPFVNPVSTIFFYILSPFGFFLFLSPFGFAATSPLDSLYLHPVDFFFPAAPAPATTTITTASTTPTAP